MKNVIIAPVGRDIENLFVSLKDFPANRVVLISRPSFKETTEKTKKELEDKRIEVHVTEIKGNLWEELFKKIAELKQLEEGKEIMINNATGNRLIQCAVTSAAFVNGLKTISVEDGETILLPILKFSYYRMLTDKKMELLNELGDETCCASLEELAERTGLSMPLVSYHVNGNLKSEGLKELGLVDTIEHQGKIELKITTLGKLLLKGYIKTKDE